MCFCKIMLRCTYQRVFTVLLVLYVAILSEKLVTGQLTNDTLPAEAEQDCQQRLLEDVFNCVSRYNIDFNVFILIVSERQQSDDAENATVPAILEGTNVTEFRTQICSVRNDVMRCILESAQTLINTPACSRSAPGEDKNAFNQDLLINDQRYLIKEQMEAIIGQYDVFCAHPCRISLLDDMRACYEKNELDSKFFISKESGGPVIGADSYDVDKFCTNRVSIVSCLKQTRDDCEESHLVLSAIGLDLDLMEKGFAVLCEHQDAYLASLDCFESHTPEVGFCHSIKYRGIITMARRAREHKWSQEKYFEEICEVILRHIQCDMDAWADKNDEDCNENVLALKRLLHCSLIPKQCEMTQNSTIKDICHPKVHSSGESLQPSLIIFTLTASFMLVFNKFVGCFASS